MQTALRKMGNSTGLILPKPILQALGVSQGAPMELVVEEGRVIATPIKHKARDGWEADAERIGKAELSQEDREWLSSGNEGDDALTW